MSLIGPRPLLFKYIDLYSRNNGGATWCALG